MTTEPARLQAVLGTGPLGLAVARHLSGRGHRVRVVNRSGRADLPASVEVVSANVAEGTEVRSACDGATVVYHCANPPYAKWPELHPPLMAAIIDGAASTGAKLIFGDNLYAYGPVEGTLTEDLPDRARGPNGRTRARIARDVLLAHESGRVRAAIGRGSDFFGPHAHQSTVGDRVFARALAKFERTFGWKATPLPEAVRATVAWFREHRSRLAGRLMAPEGCVLRFRAVRVSALPPAAASRRRTHAPWECQPPGPGPARRQGR